MLVNFMIIGAQKCGTTTLFDILNSHPSLVGSSPKEPHFFSNSVDWKAELPKYENLFKQRDGVQYFEGSTSYTFYPLKNFHIWNDLFAYNPGLKFIYLVRDPISRVISSYMHCYERGYTNLGIEDAIRKERSYIDITRYYTQISPFIKKFGREQVMMIDFDDLIKRRDQVVLNVAKFLDVDPSQFGNYQTIHSNASVTVSKLHRRFDNPSLPLKAVRKWMPSVWSVITDNSKRGFDQKPALSDDFKEMILTMLESEIRELEQLMAKDLSHWMVLPKARPTALTA